LLTKLLTVALAIGFVPCLSLSAQNKDAQAPLENAQSEKAELAEKPDETPKVGLPDPIEADGERYEIAEFVLEYAQEHSKHPDVATILQTQVTLMLTSNGFVAPRAGTELPTRQVRLADAPQLGKIGYYGSAVQAISKALVSALNKRGLIAVRVLPDSDQIDGIDDIREPDDKSLRFFVYTTTVGKIRTVASGDRVPLTERINHPLHEKIRRKSPLKAADPESEEQGDLLRKDALDDYLFFLNRHPGRKVEAALSSGIEPGTAALDYLVSENKPWLAYIQVSNTGTEATDEWRQRFGFVHNQLFDNDDILNIEYTTASFDESHAFNTAYDAPLGDMDRIRWSILGGWNLFDASEVGLALADFKGETLYAGAAMYYNIYQHRELFIDVFGGAQVENLKIESELLGIEEEQNFLVPFVGVRLQLSNEIQSLFASVRYEANWAGLAGTDSDLDDLGRADTENDFTILRWETGFQFFLEPILNPNGWRDPDTPESSTLAHEISLTFRGQHSLGDRLIPQKQGVAGGMFTVRGYDESIASGDTVLVSSVEYRFNLPRVLAIQPDPNKTPFFGGPFRMAPQIVYGRPDWDLILRGFLDFGYTINEDNQIFESGTETLLSTGVGIEFQYRYNLTVRVDWGYTLHDVGFAVESGESRVHFLINLTY